MNSNRPIYDLDLALKESKLAIAQLKEKLQLMSKKQEVKKAKSCRDLEIREESKDAK